RLTAVRQDRARGNDGANQFAYIFAGDVGDQAPAPPGQDLSAEDAFGLLPRRLARFPLGVLFQVEFGQPLDAVLSTFEGRLCGGKLVALLNGGGIDASPDVVQRLGRELARFRQCDRRQAAEGQLPGVPAVPVPDRPGPLPVWLLDQIQAGAATVRDLPADCPGLQIADTDVGELLGHCVTPAGSQDL